MRLDEEQQKHLENKVKELHNNVRHITQLGMTWFAFFVTVNYVTMSWLPKDPSREIIWIIAGVFILQNCLGIFGICMVNKTAAAKAAQVSIYENWLLKVADAPPEGLARASIPVSLYKYIAWFLMTVLFFLMLAWVGIWYYYSK